MSILRVVHDKASVVDCDLIPFIEIGLTLIPLFGCLFVGILISSCSWNVQ